MCNGIKDENEMAHSVVLLTGASRGIGRQIAHTLIRRGYVVAMMSRTAATDPVLREAIDIQGPAVAEWQADVGDYQSVRGVVREVLARWGRIDALINNAGQKLFDEFLQIAPAQFEQVVRTNLLGPVYLCNEVVPVMLRQRYGRIINISSRAGLEFYALGTAYCASKAGLIGFSQSLADALRGTDVTVNVLCPPTVLTPEYLEQVPGLDTRRLVKVEQITRVVLDLLQPDCHMTGRIFPFYSPRSFLRGILLDVGKYLQWLPQLRYRVW